MSPGLIVPVAKALYLCDGHIAFPGGKTDLIGIFNSIRPKSYPHLHKDFVVYARLGQGLGPISFFVEVRSAGNRQLIHVSNTHTLTFPSRDTTVEMVITMQVLFHQAGPHLVELYCENQWVADATLDLL
jgi:uncharacterized protein DUF6941